MHTIYQDAQQELGPLGEAKLTEYVKSGLPFILDEEQEHHQKVYRLDYYKLKWQSKTELGESIIHSDKEYPIRVLHHTGIITSTPSKEEEDTRTIQETYLTDKFIKVNGISSF
jgi:hypothetical protein